MFSSLTLNELEITVGNHDSMELRGFNLSTEITAGAAGSAELSIAMRDRVMAAQLGIPDPTDGVTSRTLWFSSEILYCNLQRLRATT